MNVSKKIDNQLKQIPEGTTFRYQGLSIAASEYTAATKKIERLIAEGTLKRASKGVFYKPKQTIFGALNPSENELLKQYLFKNGQRVAYITGVSLYNKMGLTTQIPAVIDIASPNKRLLITIGNVSIKSVKSYVEVTDNNYELLGILDALKDCKDIMDADKKTVLILLLNTLKTLTAEEISNLITYALNYPPRVRALLGAMLETIDDTLTLYQLKSSLNPFSKYDYGIKTTFLPNALKWQLK